MATLLQLSDVHFGPKHQADRAAALLELVERERPGLVVLSGDLTQRAKVAQFRAARQFVDRLAAPTVFVPGNHDVPLWRLWERLLVPFGAWRRGFGPELVRDHGDPDWAVVGINTAHAWTTKHGRIERRDIRRLAGRFARLPEQALRVVVVHHPLVTGPEFSDEPAAVRGRQLLAAAHDCGVELVLGGHLHHAFEVPAERSLPGGGPLVVQCGTSSSSRGRHPEIGRNSINWITADEAQIVVERRLWQEGTARFEVEHVGRFPRRRNGRGRDIIRRS